MKARPIFEALSRKRAGDRQAQYELAKTSDALGRLYVEMGRITDADESYRDALDRVAALLQDHPESIEYRRLEGSVLTASHRVFKALEKSDRLEDALKRAVAVREGLVRENPNIVLDRANLAETKAHLGDFYVRRNQVDLGIGLAKEAVAEWTSIVKAQAQDQKYMSALANNLISLGIIYSGMNRKQEAAAQLERASKFAKGSPEKIPASSTIVMTWP